MLTKENHRRILVDLLDNIAFMRNVILIVLTFIVCSLQTISAQNYKIEGVIEDTLGNSLIASTVLLLEKADSTLVEFTTTAMDGSFRFKNIPAGNHLIKSTYIGYVPLTVDASSTDGSDVNLGLLKMSELAAELMEVVIKAAKAPIVMRGDTVEYDASTFKVPDGSTVEDLLRRLPGIEVESDGSITADGNDVNRVTVDGKSFFGSDPKAATKNLPAEGISKVQVFDTKTEQEEITGGPSESEEKTMNLELKEEFKKGGFGKVIAGVGDVDRKELKGNYNKFNKKIQFSLVGVGNNTGRNGLSWDDYQDFMGSGAWNFGDDGDYGFGDSGGYWSFGGDNGIESSIRNLFFSGTENGFPENYITGVNFNYDHKKTKLSAVYYFSQNGLVANSQRDEDKFYQAFTQNEEMSSAQDDVSRGHRVEVEFEKELDSLHTIKLTMNAALVDDRNLYAGNSSLAKDGLLTSASDFTNNTNTNGHLLNSTFVFRKSFMKPGRKMGFNVAYLTTELEDNWTQNSDTDFFDENGDLESVLTLNQENNNIADKNVFKANALYVEPLSKRFFWETFLNYRDREETGRRIVEEVEFNTRSLNDDLSRSYENTIGYRRVGSSIRYSHDGLNVTTGAAFQQFDLGGEFRGAATGNLLGTVDKQFNNFIPYLSMSYSPVRNTRLRLSFSRNPSEPSIDDLQPLVDNTNPLFIRVGNPTLIPQIDNQISMRASQNYPLHDLRISGNARLSFSENQFSTEETVDDRLITTSRPINVDGGKSIYYALNMSVPIKRNKIKLRVSYNSNLRERISLVNSQENNTTVKSHNPSIKLDFTPSQDYSFYLSARYTTSNTSYDINTSQDQNVKRIAYSAEVNAKLVAGIFLSSTLAYDKYTNDRFNLERTIPILNSSIYKYFLKDNQLEVRLSVYDGFNQNVGFNQSAYGIGISQSVTESLARYSMLSVTYNIRGMKTDVRKKSWW